MLNLIYIWNLLIIGCLCFVIIDYKACLGIVNSWFLKFFNIRGLYSSNFSAEESKLSTLNNSIDNIIYIDIHQNM
ncbi:hypothetical protein RchiOBHm_Chr6g0269711 [Rosa chinensis]|uniref:Uncharacterized protein n=1 Tax=Rosa chinensis TaxID=74649 RepID=A0A2P6PQJ5_ROSCH|nr:hypothetical protein RchiOBHm_Chr6g0269711 [Rosa chinensis]